MNHAYVQTNTRAQQPEKEIGGYALERETSHAKNLFETGRRDREGERFRATLFKDLIHLGLLGVCTRATVCPPL